jgi:hypothetical protein
MQGKAGRRIYIPTHRDETAMDGAPEMLRLGERGQRWRIYIHPRCCGWLRENRQGLVLAAGVTLFAGVGGFQVAVGGVGLRLVATSGRGQLVLLDGFVALVKEVEHLAGVELGATA